MRKKISLITKLFILAMFVLAACGPSAEEIATQTAAAWTPTPTQTNTPTPSPTPLPPTNTPTPEPSSPAPLISAAPPAEDIIAFTNIAMAEASSYHFEMVATIEALMSGMALNVPVTFSGDFLAPDNMQGALSIDLFGMISETKFVTIGDLAYSTDIETGEWVLGAKSALPFDINDFVGSNQIGLITPELVGIEVVDDVWTYHLVGTIPADSLGEDFAGGEDEATMDYWIGADDFLVRRLTMVVALFGELIEGSGETEMKISVEIVINDYGKEVVIVSPAD